MGRLPALMGIPAGGSLTADQWSIAATVVLPLAVRGVVVILPLEPAQIYFILFNKGATDLGRLLHW